MLSECYDFTEESIETGEVFEIVCLRFNFLLPALWTFLDTLYQFHTSKAHNCVYGLCNRDAHKGRHVHVHTGINTGPVHVSHMHRHTRARAHTHIKHTHLMDMATW